MSRENGRELGILQGLQAASPGLGSSVAARWPGKLALSSADLREKQGKKPEENLNLLFYWSGFF